VTRVRSRRVDPAERFAVPPPWYVKLARVSMARGFPPHHVVDEGKTPMSTNRYDRFSEVGNREYQESRALHIVADLVTDIQG
jgi:hypothetical protein